MAVLSGKTGEERKNKESRKNKLGGGRLRQRGSAHQDVPLQEQPRLDGDTDAGLAISLDVAKGDRQAEGDRVAEGRAVHFLPAAPLPEGH